MDHELFNDNDSFEQFLRESTEDFKMYPSRKVWYSLYNNLHPGRKWPSLAVCLILVSAILFMDVSNNNKINKRTQNAADSPIANSFTEYFTNFEAKENSLAVLPPLVNNQKNKVVSIIGNGIKSEVSVAENTSPVIVSYNEENLNNNIEIIKNEELLLEKEANNSLNKTINNNTFYKSDNEYLPTKNNDKSVVKNIEDANQLLSFNADKLKLFSNPMQENDNNISEKFLMKSFQDDHAFYNKPLLSKFMKNASLEFYITPSVGYRAWFKNNDVKLSNNSALIAINPTIPVEEDVNQNAAYNMEVGLALNYKVGKKLALKMGVQFNNTNYVINAGQLFHPTQTTLLLENSNTGISMLEPHTSYYSNRQAPGNEKRLFNKTTQFSIPVGVDYQLGSKRNISWHAAASIQPTYVAAGDANVLSADARNYVKMPSLLRTWNANTSFETFVSIETRAGFSVNVGPQFRYQLLSTYDNDYNYSEKLYNIGIKLGITRGF